MKRYLSGMLLTVLSCSAFAQAYSNAVQFAQQAGVIAGAVQACSQDITTYNSRVIEAVNALGLNASDRQNAMIAYQKALSDVQYTQSRLHNLNCGTVIQQFNSLPLMQSNYEQAVIPQLTQMNNPGATATTAAPTNNPTPPAASATITPSSEPQIATVTPTTTTPSTPTALSAPVSTQSYVSANGQ